VQFDDEFYDRCSAVISVAAAGDASLHRIALDRVTLALKLLSSTTIYLQNLHTVRLVVASHFDA